MNKNNQKKLLKNIGSTFEKLRLSKSISQEKISEGICDRSLISKIEKGKQKSPNIIVLNELSQKMEVDFSVILDIAQNGLDNSFQKSKKKILNLLFYGKYSSAERIANSCLQPTKNIEDFKYDSLIKATKEFFNGEYENARDYFLKGLGAVKRINDKTILSFVDIFLLNGYIASYENIYVIKNNRSLFFNSIIRNLVYVLYRSAEFYLFFEPKLIVRILIYLFAYFRLFELYENCEILIKEIEQIIDEYAYYESNIDFAIEKIIYYLQIDRADLITNTIEEVKMKLKAFELVELEKHFEKLLEKLSNELSIKL